MPDNESRCDSCEVLYIQGEKCHEVGCPDAWQDSERECIACGYSFVPDSKEEVFCEQSCKNHYYDLPCDDVCCDSDNSDDVEIFVGILEQNEENKYVAI